MKPGHLEWELDQLGNKMEHLKYVFPSIYLLS